MRADEADDYSDSDETDEVRSRKRRGGRGLLLFLVVLLLLLLAGAAGYYRFVAEPVANEAGELRGRVSELERAVGVAEGRAAAAERQRDADAAELARLREERGGLVTSVQAQEAQIAELEAARHALEQQMGGEIASGDIELRGAGGELSIGLMDQILFPSGSAELSNRGKAVLRRVAQSLTSVANRVIEVKGHTDSMPLSDALMERFPTNWELSTARATNVVRFLTDECGIPGERLVATGHAQFRPVASNRNQRGRSRNRRIELDLVRAPRRSAEADPAP